MRQILSIPSANTCHTMNKFVAIIPARYQSSRFPGKPLARILGKTMIERVYAQVKKAVDHVWVATDDIRIEQEVKRFGGNVIMTSPDHQSGTDRLREAAAKIATPDCIIINVQGDEPFIRPEQIEGLKKCFDSPEVNIATLARPFDASKGFDALSDPNSVKVVFSDAGKALYFSRSVIPYCRGVNEADWPSETEYYTHIGLYAYRYKTLIEITQLDRSTLEIAESLEQLRWLQNGYDVHVAISKYPTIGIDTPADLEAAIEFAKNLEQNA